MPISVTCDQCDKHYEVSEKGVGRKFKCKGCGAVLTVPEAPVATTTGNSSNTSASDADTAGASPTKSRKSSAGESSASGKSRSGATGKTTKRTSTAGTGSSADSKSGTRKKSASRAGKTGSSQSAARKKKKKKSAGAGGAAGYELFDGNFEDDDIVDDDDIFEDGGDDDYEEESGGGYDDYEADYDGYGEDDYAEDYEPAPRRSAPKKKKKKQKAKSEGGGGGLAMTFNINRLNIALLIFGGMAIFMGIREARLAANSSSEPTTMTAEELIADGPGDNLYVTVTGINGDLDETVIYYTEKSGGDVGRISEAYIPARPINTSPTSPFKLIVYSDDATSEVAVAGVARQRQHTGMIVNDIMSISGEKRDLLETTPNLNVDDAWILHSGREPSGAGLVIFYFLGGALLLAGGLFWMFFVHS